MKTTNFKKGDKVKIISIHLKDGWYGLEELPITGILITDAIPSEIEDNWLRFRIETHDRKMLYIGAKLEKI